MKFRKNGRIELPEALQKAILNGTCVPFLGAGFSKQADPHLFPSWTELLKRLAHHLMQLKLFPKRDKASLLRLIRDGKFLMAAETLKESAPPDEYFKFLQDQFDPATFPAPSEAHRLLLSLNVRLLITTNYDRLIEDAYAKHMGRALTVVDYRDAARVQRRLKATHNSARPLLFKIHGDIDMPSELVLSESDYRRLMFDEQGYRTVLSSIFVTHTILIIGFSLADPEILLHLSFLRHSFQKAGAPDYMLIAEGSMTEIEANRVRKDYGIQPIYYPSTADHRGVRAFLEACHDLKK